MPIAIEPLPISPLSRRCVPIMAAAGDEIIVWGGFLPLSDRLNDGASYNRSTCEWELLPPSPLKGRARSATAWTGRELLIIGGRGEDDIVFSDGARYDPLTRSWSAIPYIPDGGRTHAASCWTGESLLVVGGLDEDARPASNTLRFSPSTGEWNVLPPDPIDRRSTGCFVWTGEVGVAWGGHGDGCEHASVLDGDRWHVGAPSPLDRRTEIVAVELGGQAFFWGGEIYDQALNDGAFYDPANDSWGLIYPAPAKKPSADAVTLDGYVMIFGGNLSGRSVNILLYESDIDAWSEPQVDFKPGSGSRATNLAPDTAALWTGFPVSSDLAIISLA